MCESQFSHALYSLQAGSLINRHGLPPPVAVRDYIGRGGGSAVKLGHWCECRRQWVILLFGLVICWAKSLSILTDLKEFNILLSVIIIITNVWGHINTHVNYQWHSQEFATWGVGRSFPPLVHQLQLKKCSEYWSGRIEADQSDPRKLWKSVDTLLGRGCLPASSAIDVASFSRFFADKVAKVRSSTSRAPPPIFSRLQSGASFCRRHQRYTQAAWQVIGCQSAADPPSHVPER